MKKGKKRKTLEQRGLQWAHKYGQETAMPIDYVEAWLAGYKAGATSKRKRRKK